MEETAGEEEMEGREEEEEEVIAKRWLVCDHVLLLTGSN